MRDPPLDPRLPGLWHGADYNPEQWDSATWDEDLRLMREAGCNAMSIGIFSWVALEPAEGVYTFDWLDRIMDQLTANGLFAVLATPSAAQPAWLSRKYPEVLRQGPDNETGRHGFRVNFCPSSPVYREQCAAMSERLAGRYGRHPALLLWHVSNEYYKECHCPRCVAAFRLWLQQRYGTLEALNAAWWTTFWSHCYSDWEEIDSAHLGMRIEFSIPGQTLDWWRFTVDQTVAFCANEIAPLRRLTPGVPVTTNGHMTLHGTTDWSRFAPLLDVMSWDSYPRYTGRSRDDLPKAVETAFTHDVYRGYKQGRPFLRMESSPCEAPGRRQMRPGILRLTGLQALAHGADSVQYFQWRNGRGGVEQFHGAIVEHAGHGRTRSFRDHAALGRTLAQLAPVRGSRVPAAAAFLWSKENRWAFDLRVPYAPCTTLYQDTALAHYRALWEASLPVDVIAPDAPLDGYRLVVAPMLYMVTAAQAARLAAFVAAGGILATTYWSGYVDEHLLVHPGGFPGPLRRLLGLWSEELDGLPPDERNGLRLAAGNALGLAGEYETGSFCDLIHLETARALGFYTRDYYAGQPALAVNAFGAGKAYYLATAPAPEFLGRWYAALAAQAGVAAPLATPIPPGLSVRRRSDGEHDFLFLLNFLEEPRSLTLPEAWQDLESGAWREGLLTLSPHASLVLARPCA